jgi:ATP-dependent DNA helicase PIF1
MVLTKDQQLILTHVERGDNIFITGAGGVGKSFVIREIVHQLYSNGINFKLTASTGVAGINIGGTTLHFFAGLGLAKEDVNKLTRRVMNKKHLLQRWRTLSTLIIDEISVLDIEFFCKLEHIARRVRQSKQPFGGIQIILVGDFLQLPNIQKREDEIEYLFEHKVWKDLGLKIVQLKQIFRQRDKKFVELLASLRMGKVTDEADEFIKSCMNKKIDKEAQIKPTYIYPRNVQVDTYNTLQLNKLEGEDHVYKGIGKAFPEKSTFREQTIKMLSTIIDNFMIPPNLLLRIGAQVMLLINIPKDNLCNGSRGVIIGFKNDLPVVLFQHCEKIIDYFTWETKSPGIGTVEYTHMPLKLAYAISIHKSMGLSIDTLAIDIGPKIFTNSQAYVSISRAVNKEGLFVLNYSRDSFFVNEKALKFYEGL